MRDDPDDWDCRSGLERNAYIHVIPRMEMIQGIAVLILVTNLYFWHFQPCLMVEISSFKSHTQTVYLKF